MSSASGLPIEKNFEQVDMDKDGKISKEDLKATFKANRGPSFFEVMDSDHDGYISKADISQAKEALLKKKANGESMTRLEEMLFKAMSSTKGLALENDFDEVDMDKDGKVSK